VTWSSMPAWVASTSSMRASVLEVHTRKGGTGEGLGLGGLVPCHAHAHVHVWATTHLKLPKGSLYLRMPVLVTRVEASCSNTAVTYARAAASVTALLPEPGAAPLTSSHCKRKQTPHHTRGCNSTADENPPVPCTTAATARSHDAPCSRTS
jgi:hypothetical protein